MADPVDEEGEAVTDHHGTPNEQGNDRIWGDDGVLAGCGQVSGGWYRRRYK